MSKYRVRQKDIIPEHLLSEFTVGIVGCGAVGSHTANSLARMGIQNFVLIDPDTVSSENINNQGFYPSDINLTKVDVVADDINAINGHAKVHALYERLSLHHSLILTGCNVLISAVDSMESRRQCFDFAREHSIAYMIDPRMGAEKLSMSTVNLTEYSYGLESWYDNMLFPDSKAVEEPCTAKSTIYTALLISGLVTKSVKDILTGNGYTQYITWNVGANSIGDYSVRNICTT